ncbi:permease for cytosine/purines, uracil, thiamine, allantoin-domain-containing protein [Xylariaceae sp. FL0255]|nr:permease for cytosine/purines, uracil, thiamine, allantoin-domain-containing protein [Xylariaceae sp. FL0255]
MDEKSTVASTDIEAGESQTQISRLPSWLVKLSSWGVELRGISPVPLEERVDKHFINVLFVWTAANVNPFPIITGILGTFIFHLSLRDCSLVILFATLPLTVPPAYFCTFGSRTGLRQMIFSRYTFGYYLISIVVLLNIATLGGFAIIGMVLGGSTLSAVSDGHIDSTAGIVIIGLLALVVSFGGYKFLHQFERYSWIIALIAIVITTGVGGRELLKQSEQPPASPATIVSFIGVIAGFMIPYAGLASDISVYCDPSVSTLRIFSYTLAGLCIPSVPLMILGAAIGGAIPNIDAWNEGYHLYSVGGVLEAMLKPAGGFGKLVAVLLALSLLGNLTVTIYPITLNFQILLPFFARIPRMVFAIVYTAIGIPVAAVAAHSFFVSLENFIYLIAYWSGAYVGVIGVEHFVFRKANPASYDPMNWNQPRKLPTGISAVLAAGLSFGLVIPAASQVLYTGPIGATTGDLGFETALVLSSILYLPIRWLELKWRPV